MLASDQPILKGVELGGKQFTLHLDNEALMTEFRAMTEYYRQILPVLQGRTFEAGMTAERAAAVLAAQTVGRDMLGVVGEHSMTENGHVYAQSAEATIEDFRRPATEFSTAVCTEWAALTHQLLSFAGEQSEYISVAMVVSGADEDIQHAYQLIHHDGGAHV